MKLALPRLALSAKIWLLDLLVVGICTVVLAVFIAGDRLRRENIAFDAALWRAERAGCTFYSSSVRSRMSKDLAKTLVQSSPRPSKDDVEQMLGKPEASRSGRLWSYSAGTSTIDCLTFDVEFDERGTVRAAYLTQH